MYYSGCETSNSRLRATRKWLCRRGMSNCRVLSIFDKTRHRLHVKTTSCLANGPVSVRSLTCHDGSERFFARPYNSTCATGGALAPLDSITMVDRHAQTHHRTPAFIID